MLIGVIGLGLIGGSMAKAINQNTDYSVYGYDIEDNITKKAILVGAIEGELTEKMIPECDMLFLGLYPQDAIEFLKKNAPRLKKDCIVMDTGGVKQVVNKAAAPLAAKYGFTFIGTHPMAGVEHKGFEYSKKALFNGASLILVPLTGTPIEKVDEVIHLARQIGFVKTPIVEPDEHDRIIAYTSQLAHVVSSAYVMSPTASDHCGFSAGSYRDMTRVAKLNEIMWTELFLENPDFLAEEIDRLVERLNKFSKVIKDKDEEKLCEMLKEGRIRKLEIDREIF
jgi:prephenate dehydrogenase